MNYNSSRWSQDAQTATAVYQSSIIPPKRHYAAPATKSTEYASFWVRYMAYLIDTAFLATLVVVPAMFDPSFRDCLIDNSLAAVSVLNLFVVLYFAGMESSASQGTLGKMVMGIKVTDVDGEQLSFLRALARTGAKTISGLFFNIGFIMAAFTGRRQALHDMLASSVVIREIR